MANSVEPLGTGANAAPLDPTKQRYPRMPVSPPKGAEHNQRRKHHHRHHRHHRYHRQPHRHQSRGHKDGDLLGDEAQYQSHRHERQMSPIHVKRGREIIRQNRYNDPNLDQYGQPHRHSGTP